MDNNNIESVPKLSGYLKKKTKLNLVSSYKKYWFVLEGRLLLYYHSKDEYEAISPFKGSITLAPPCTVKPCSSNPGVFQIQTRNNVITLKAPNVDNQNKWMQSIIAVLNQNQHQSTKLSHFRYSLDDVNKDIELLQDEDRRSFRIQRLQKLGAQSYSGSLLAMSGLKKSFNVSDTSINRRFDFNLKSKLKKAKSKSNSALSLKSNLDGEDGGGYRLIKSSSNGSVEIRNLVLSTPENLYERLSSSSYSSNEKLTENLYNVAVKRRNSTSNAKQAKKEFLKKRHSLDINNHTYSIPYSTPKVDQRKVVESLLIDNENYCGIDTIITNPDTDEELIYTEPRIVEGRDFNENNVENLYASVNKTRRSSDEYVTAENTLYTSSFQRKEEAILKNNMKKCAKILGVEEDNLLKISKLEKLEKDKLAKLPPIGNQTKSVKKRPSFTIWKKKKTKDDTGKAAKIETNIYETIDEAVKVEKPGKQKDKNKLKKEDSKTKEEKSILFQKTKPKSKSFDESNEQIKSLNAKEKVNLTDQSKMEILSELQNILEQKKPIVMKQLETKKEDEQEKPEYVVKKPSTSRPPYCPPKVKYSTLPTKLPRFNNTEKSLDEILYDLNNSSINPDKKVIYKQHSLDSKCPHVEEDKDFEVVLRNTQDKDMNRHSDELTRLLDELAKVTSAPVTSGGTVSLMNPQLTDEELLKLIPIKRRRNSDPDYDVPRSHRSLVNLQVKKEETSLSATRFFGPPLEDTFETCESDYSVLLSMTPDSLEPDYSIKKANNYKKKIVPADVIPENFKPLMENDLYEDVKLLSSSEKNRSFTIERVDHSIIVYNKNNIKKGADEKEEEFIDSLETSNNEIRTVF